MNEQRLLRTIEILWPSFKTKFMEGTHMEPTFLFLPVVSNNKVVRKWSRHEESTLACLHLLCSEFTKVRKGLCSRNESTLSVSSSLEDLGQYLE